MVQYDEVMQLALQLTPAEQVRLVERLASALSETFRQSSPANDSPVWNVEDVLGLMKIEPLTGAEIVARGLTGGWSDEGIQDGAEWVNEQKRKRQARKHW